MSEAALPPPVSATATRSKFPLIGLAFLAAALIALFYYKWGGALRAIQGVEASGKLSVSPDGILKGGILLSTLHYFQRVWIALAYGLVIGAVMRSLVSPRWIASLLGGRGARPTVAGAVAGSPLMLCSCCVTPVFTGACERGAAMGPALSLMLASPGLNIAALSLTFILMPLQFGVVRVVAAGVIVLGLAPLVGRVFGGDLKVSKVVGAEDMPMDWKAIGVRFARSLGYMAVVTVPLILAGVLLSAWLLPRVLELPAGAGALTVVLVALAATMVALPTFFEIPIAFLLLQLGAPPGAAVALLVAGPIVNLPSLFVLARETSARVAASVGAGVFAIAVLAGLAASF
ncbi:MAG TPA: permease [Myxococcales bacterium]|nr:permease [Myxococcales bacterium]